MLFWHLSCYIALQSHGYSMDQCATQQFCWRSTEDCSSQLFSVGLLSLKITRGDCAYCTIQCRMHRRDKYQQTLACSVHTIGPASLSSERTDQVQGELSLVHQLVDWAVEPPNCLRLIARTALTLGLRHVKALSMLGSFPFAELQNTS